MPNWQSFSIGANEVARFNLPSSLSAILNRVTGSDPSLIAGRLSSNGQVYLINPNGIVVGPNGRVNTGAFVASTLNVPDAAFMRGSGMTFKGESGAGIQVLGQIKATNGDVVLVAAAVDNKGRITAPNGQAILGAGGQFYYVPDGQSDIVIAAPPAGGSASVTNSGAIAAANVQLKAAGNPYALAVNNSGLISATAVRQVGGRVILDGGAGDTVDSGAIAARSGDKGGTVAVTGRTVTLTGTASIDASGPAGGGTVKIGGGARGTDTTLANATTTTVAPGARIRANATDRGNGGSVVVWGTDQVKYAGRIEAKGGPNGGNGGFAEVSGNTLAYQGVVDLTAPRGTTGTILLDPVTLSICDLCATTPASILATLNSANAVIDATSSLTVDSPIIGTQVNRLTLDAPNIAVNATISLPNGLLSFTDTTLPAGGTFSSVVGATIAAGQIDIVGNFDVTTLAGPVSTAALNLIQSGVTATISNAANAIGAFNFNGQGSVYTGNIAVSSTSAMTVSGIASTNGALSLTAGGNLTMQTGTALTVSGTTTLASTGGTFINNAGTGLIAGTGRARLYASTDAGFNDGGLGYTQFNPVTLGSDPMSGLATVTYLARSTALPALTITANDVGRNYGATNPTFTAAFSGGSSADLVVAEQLGLSGGPAVNVGTYAIVPSGAVSSTRAVGFVNGTLTVNRAPLTITAKDTSRDYGSSNPTFTASYSGLVNSDTSAVVSGLSLTTTATSGANVGGYAITASGGTASNYTISYVAGALTVNRAPLTITANDTSRDYGASNPTFTASYLGLVNSDTSSVVSGLSLTTTATSGSNAGSYAIAAVGGTASNYTISHVNGTLTVNRAPLTITANDASRDYGSGNPTFTASYSGLVNSDTSAVVSGLSLTTTATSGSNVGGYAITASGGTASNYTISHVNGTLTINRVPLTITANDTSRDYGSSNPTFTAAYSGLVNSDTSSVVSGLSLTTTATSGSNVGGYAITASGGTASNYTISLVNGTLTVNRAPLKITANDTARDYGSGNPTFTASYSGLVNSDTSAVVSGLSLTTSATSGSNAGSYAIAASGGTASNYTISLVNGTLTVNRAPLTITANDALRDYGSSNPTFTASYSGLVNSDTSAVVSGLNLATTATSGSNVGGYAITASGGTASNYTISFVNGTLTVDRVPLTITANDTSRDYGSGNPAFTASYSGLVNSDTSSVVSGLKLATTATGGSNIGSYTITASGGTASNYTISRVNGTLTVNRAPLTITANDVSRSYGAANPTLTASYAGLVNGDTSAVVSGLSLTTTATSGSSIGDYTITALGGTASNYAISDVNGTLTVTRAPLTITANDVSRVYGASNPTLTASYSGLVNGDTSAVVSGLKLATKATSASNVGGYTITASGGTASNYAISDVNGTLTVTRAPLTITANDVSRAYGAANPALTASYSGLVNGDTSAVVSGLGLSTTATSGSNVGDYKITASGGIASNYAITRANGTLTIDRAELSIVANSALRQKGAANPAFTATYSGLVNGDTAAVVSGLAFSTPANASSSVGTYKITPSGATAGNYKITLGTGTLTVSTVPITITLPAAPPPTVTAAPSTTNSTTGVTTFDIGPLTLSPTTPRVAPPSASESLVVCGAGCLGFGNGPQQAEFDSIIKNFVATLAGKTTPPLTANHIYKALADPARSAQMMSMLMPSVLADLTAILSLPQSQWTAQQSGFVQAVQNYMQMQRQAAVQQALADYQAWAEEQVAERTKLLNEQGGGLSFIVTTMNISSDLPVPPRDILLEAKIGLSMSGTQLASYSALQNASAGPSVSPGGVAGVIGGTATTLSSVAVLLGADVSEASSANKLISELPGGSKLLPHTQQAFAKAADPATKLKQIALLQKLTDQHAKELKVAQEAASEAAKSSADAKAGAKAAQDAVEALKQTPEMQEALNTTSQASKDQLTSKLAQQDLKAAQEAKASAEAKALSTSKEWSSTAADLEKAKSELKAADDAVVKALAKSKAADEAVEKTGKVVSELAARSDEAVKELTAAGEAWQKAVRESGPLSKEAKAAQEALQASSKASTQALKAQEAAEASLKLQKSLADSAKTAADTADATKSAKVAEVGKLAGEAADAEKAAKAAATTLAKTTAEASQAESAAAKATSAAAESALAAKDTKILASLKELKNVEEGAKTAKAVAEGLESTAASAAARAEKAVVAAEKALAATADELTAAVKGAKAIGIADDALKGIGIAEDIIKGIRVGTAVAGAATAGIPGVGEIVGAIADLIQIGLSTAAIVQNVVFNKNLESAAAAAEKPITLSDLAAMAKSPDGQSQLLMYLTAMASTNGQPPPVTKPTMTLQQIANLAQQM